MAIEFQCPHCQGMLRLKDKFAGQKGSCKHCGGEIRVPNAPSQGEPELLLLEDAPPVPASRPAAALKGPSTNGASKHGALANGYSNGQTSLRAQAPAAAAGPHYVARVETADLIRFHCDQCGGAVKTLAGAAGRSVVCPRCAQRLRVPGTPAAKPASAPTARSAVRPAAVAAVSPVMEGLELLPEPDGLELLPETNSLLDALDDPTLPAPRQLSASSPSRLMPVSTKKRKKQRQLWQEPAILVPAIALPVVALIAVISFRSYGSTPVIAETSVTTTGLAQNGLVTPPTPISAPPQPTSGNNSTASSLTASAVTASTPAPPTEAAPPAFTESQVTEPQVTPPTMTEAPQEPPPIVGTAAPPAGSTPETVAMIAEAQGVLNMFEQNLQLAQQMVDVPSTQRVAREWALQFIDSIDAAERLNRFAGRVVSINDKEAYENLGRGCENRLFLLDSHIVRLAGIADIQPLLADALEKAVVARPNSPFAQTLRNLGAGSRGMVGLTRRRAEMQAESNARRVERDARKDQMRADSQARMNDMRERAKARSNMHNRRLPGRK